MAGLPETVAWHEDIYLLEKTDPVSGGAVIDEATKQGISNLAPKQLADRTQWLRGRVEDLSRVESVDVTVGATGDFATINAALEELSKSRSGYVQDGFISTITLQAGFVMEEQVIVRGVDLSAFRIIGVDAETVIARDTLTIEAAGPVGYAAFSQIDGGVLPVIGQLFRMDTSGSGAQRHGVVAFRSGGQMIVEGGCGVKDAGGIGCKVATASTARLNSCVFSNAGDNGLEVANASTVQAVDCDFTNAGGSGAFVSEACVVNLGTSDCSGAANYGILAERGSTINARGAIGKKGASNSPDDIVVLQGGQIVAFGATGGKSQAVNVTTNHGTIYEN